MINKLLSISLLFLAFLPLLAAAQCGDSYGKNGLFIKYTYGKNSSLYEVASSATACFRGKMMATAKAIKIIPTNLGPNQLEVEETHYDDNGRVTYKGIISFCSG
jgi:hypothetical protein